MEAGQLTEGQGSPPHGRGKVWLLPLVDFQSRITPAWAGKSFSITARGRVRRDHPRMGGEKEARDYPKEQVWGSPPRRRGKAFSVLRRQFRFRITPAWAGKSSAQPRSGPPGQDHPRVGGEKDRKPTWNVCAVGSPPRGRGKGADLGVGDQRTGITPA